MKRFQSIRGIIVVVLLTSLLFCHSAQAQEATVKSLYNEAIDNIVVEILAVKAGYPELESFSGNAVKIGKDGYKSISYVRDSSGISMDGKDQYAYRFSIALKTLDKSEVQAEKSVWEAKYPLLGVKVVIDSQSKGEWTSLDLSKIVENNLDPLRIMEQEFLPFHLEVSTDRQVYSVAEEIMLNVSLKNKGVKPFKIAELDQNALYCSIGEDQWGSPEPQIELSRVLKVGASVQKMLRILAPETPQELIIACSYALGYKGVRPYDRIRVSILPKR